MPSHPDQEAAKRPPGIVLPKQPIRALGVLEHVGNPFRAGSGPQDLDSARRRLPGVECGFPEPNGSDRGPIFDAVSITAGKPAGGGNQRERRLGGDLLVAEVLQPAFDRCVSTVAHEPQQIGPEQIAGESGVAGGDRVVDRPVHVSVPHVRCRRSAVQLRLELRLRPAKLGAQHLGEQTVMSRAAGVPVREQEHVRALELREHPARS